MVFDIYFIVFSLLSFELQPGYILNGYVFFINNFLHMDILTKTDPRGGLELFERFSEIYLNHILSGYVFLVTVLMHMDFRTKNEIEGVH